MKIGPFNLELNLRLKVVIFTITIILILLIISHAITSTLVAQKLSEQLRTRANNAIENVNAWLSDQLDKLLDLARLNAGSDQIIRACDWVDATELRRTLLEENSIFGIQLMLVENTKHDWIFEIVDRPWDPTSRLPRMADTLEQQLLPSRGRAEYVRGHNSIIQTVTVPIIGDDGELGLLTIGEKIDSGSLENLLVRSGSDHIHVLMNDRFVVSTITEEQQVSLLSQLPENLDPSTAYTVKIYTDQYLTMVNPILTQDGIPIANILVQFPTEENRKIIADISNALNLAAFGAFLAFSLISVFFTGRVTDNLNRLVEHVGALGEGRYEEKVEIESRDEVGVLAGAFDDLRIKLRERTQALLDANVDLDTRVREISSLNNVMVAIASNVPMDQVFGIIVHEAGRHVPVDFAYLALKDETTGQVRLLVAHGDVKKPEGSVPLVADANMAQTLEKQRNARIVQLSRPSEFSDVEWMAAQGLKTAYYTPMRSEETFIGTLCLASSSEYEHIESGPSGFVENLATEITVALQRLRLNEELQLIEGRLGRLFDSIRDGIFQTDASGNIVFLNSAARKMFGLAPGDEERTIRLQELIVKSSAMKKLLKELEKRDYVTNFAAEMTGPGASKFEAELTVNYTDDEVGKRGIEGIVRDVTVRKRLERELQRNEEFMRQVIEGTTNAIFTLDQNGALTFMNHQLAEFSGQTEEDLRDTLLIDLLNEESREVFAHRLDEVLVEGHTVASTELTVVRSDGSEIYGLLSLAPLQGQGQSRLAVGAMADITEIKKLEDHLIRNERLASMGQIAASVAHEINNPLGIILGFTQDLITERKKGDPDIPALRTIEQETERCARIVKDLLDLARADNINRKPIQLENLIEKTLPLFKLHFRDRNIRLVKKFDESPNVMGDEHQLQQVLMNVIINAVHAMEAGGELKITLSRMCEGEGGEANAVIRIADAGVGISREHLDRIFDPFFTTKRGGGSGLGLFIAHRLVEAHGGSIVIDSVKDKGTECTINLPIVEG